MREGRRPWSSRISKRRSVFEIRGLDGLPGLPCDEGPNVKFEGRWYERRLPERNDPPRRRRAGGQAAVLAGADAGRLPGARGQERERGDAALRTAWRFGRPGA